ncbi:MAG: hypothetical protein IT438_02155 [Phycisphaerales bacterium]|nr:hypothetical protein [Phycisphaerales bacterium]
MNPRFMPDARCAPTVPRWITPVSPARTGMNWNFPVMNRRGMVKSPRQTPDAPPLMANIPNDRRELLTFATAREELWAMDPSSIGLSPAETAAVGERAAEMRALIERLAQLRSEFATTARDLADSATNLRTAVNTAVRGINSFALQSADPQAVYSAARLNPPSPAPARSGPGAVIPPNPPHSLRASLETSTGAIRLTWKARQPAGVSGVVYTLARRLAGQGEYSQIALVGGKRFTDESVPAGAEAVSYRVTAQRGSLASPPSPAGEVHILLGAAGAARLSVAA